MTVLVGGWVAEFPRYLPAQLFALAVDIEGYPRFIPWCRQASIRERGAGSLGVDNRFGAGPLELRFRSSAVFEAPHRLEITAADGPFRRFRLLWRFEPVAEDGCRVRIDYEVAFRSALLQVVAGASAAEMERRVARRFREQARALFG